jgi:ApaG protein
LPGRANAVTLRAMQDVLASLFQHAAMTAGVTVRVAVNFMPDESRSEARRWFWVYHIRIENHREDAIRLRTRHWRITDSRGMVNIVDGEGVVGETPLLTPGQTYDYVSGCELMTNRGSMEGHYTFARPDGSALEVTIPFFPLAAPVRTEG